MAITLPIYLSFVEFGKASARASLHFAFTCLSVLLSAVVAPQGGASHSLPKAPEGYGGVSSLGEY